MVWDYHLVGNQKNTLQCGNVFCWLFKFLHLLCNNPACLSCNWNNSQYFLHLRMDNWIAIYKQRTKWKQKIKVFKIYVCFLFNFIVVICTWNSSFTTVKNMRTSQQNDFIETTTTFLIHFGANFKQVCLERAYYSVNLNYRVGSWHKA